MEVTIWNVWAGVRRFGEGFWRMKIALVAAWMGNIQGYVEEFDMGKR